MKKAIVSVMKIAAEKAAEVPVTVKCWPGIQHQPKMPEALRTRMKERSNQQ